MQQKQKNKLYIIIGFIFLLILFQLIFNKKQPNTLIYTQNQNTNDVNHDNNEIKQQNQMNEKVEDQEINNNFDPEIFFKRPSNYPLQETSENKFYSIGVFPIPGIKMPSFPNHQYMKFTPITIDKKKENDYWANMGYYISLYGFEYRTGDKEDYPFKLYQEDITLHYDFVQFGKKDLDEFDLLFIPPIGVTFDENFVNNLYEFINKASHQYPNFCSLQTYMNPYDRNKNDLYDTKHVFKPNWPKSQFKMFGGILIKNHIPEALVKFMFPSHYLNRYDYLLQHYCETVDEPIIVSPYNFYKVPSNAYH